MMKFFCMQWELAEVSVEALLAVLRHSHVDSVTVTRKEPQISILLQLLNDSPLLKTVRPSPALYFVQNSKLVIG